MVKEHSHPNAWSFVIVWFIIFVFLIWTTIENSQRISDLESQLENKADRVCWEEEVVESIKIYEASDMMPRGDYFCHKIEPEIDKPAYLLDCHYLFEKEAKEHICYEGFCYIKYAKEVCEIK